MELFILIITLAIFAETTFLLWKNCQKFNTNGKKRKIYVDTSALMDGRILNIAKTGFIGDDLIILKSVLRELQLLADGKDSEKRARARAGLGVVSELERVIYFDVEIFDDGDGPKKVDEELLKIAKENHGFILTIDYNLIKVAEAEKIETLNVNDLGLALRNEFLPGEKAVIKITEKGANKGQGIGHLNDGTMVVVDNAAQNLGESVEVEFTKFHETSAGKMIFARQIPTTEFEASSHRHQPLAKESKSARQKPHSQKRLKP